MDQSAGSFGTSAGWFFPRRRGASRRSRVAGAAQHEVMRCKPGTVPVCGGPGSAMHRFAGARAASHPGHTIRTSLYFPVFLQIRNLPSPVSRSQAHTPPRSRGAFFAPGGLQLCFAHPERGVGGAPRDVRVLSGTPVGHAITRRARRLARRLASHSASRRA